MIEHRRPSSPGRPQGEMFICRGRMGARVRESDKPLSGRISPWGLTNAGKLEGLRRTKTWEVALLFVIIGFIASVVQIVQPFLPPAK